MLKLATVSPFRPFGIQESNRRHNNLCISHTELCILIYERAQNDGTRREVVPRTKTNGVPLFFVSLAGKEIIGKKPEFRVTSSEGSVSIFSLNARFGREFQL